jgi:N-acetylmuramoyl-L-alanine amidase
MAVSTHMICRLIRSPALALLALLLPLAAAAQVAVTAVRVWPSPEYTRLTFESAQPLRYALPRDPDPSRLILELQNAQLADVLETLPARVPADDPIIAGAQVQQIRPGTVRIVLQLRADARPQVFPLQPVAQYAHRLVLDVYAAAPPDPLLALLEQIENGDAAKGASPAKESKPAATFPGDAAAPLARSGTASAKAAPPAAEDKPRADAARNQANAGKGGRKAAVPVVTIAIDAGHGGEDPGAHGRGGTREKDVTLRIARKLKALVDAQPGMRGVLTRDGDYFVALHDRVNRARRVRAELFVSIHADAFIRPTARGSSVFALSQRGATSAAARWLAKKENEADLIGGVNLDVPDPYLRQTLLDLSQDGNIRHSIKLGQAVLQELSDVNDLHKPHVEQAGFAVLKAPDIPSILVETAFISNPEEEKKLRSAAYQERMARAILSGIRQYFTDHPPAGREVLAVNP